MNEKHIEDLITSLYDMIQDARALPLAADKCIVERDKALDLLDEIIAQLPAELKQSRTIVESRNELIGKKRLKKVPTVIMHIYNKLVIIIGFGIFKFENMSDLGNFFKNIVGANGNAFTSSETNDIFMKYVFIFAISVLACFPIVPFIKSRLEKATQNQQGLAILGATAVSLVLLFINTAVLVATSSSNNPFLYWRF